jgi:hypothetical protein
LSEFIEALRALNRKERFYLVGFALDNTDFKLGEEFRAQLEQSFGLSIPPDAFVAMDYHLSWIYAAAVLSVSDTSRFIAAASVTSAMIT